jgi:hypothetical protein
LCHWWGANKTQAGRGTTTVTSVTLLPTLDLHILEPEQHEQARKAFDDLRGVRFLPFDQIDEDDARAELDRRLLVDVLRLKPDLSAPDGPLARLRRKLAAEPQIRGAKKTKLEFTTDGERTVPRREEE